MELLWQLIKSYWFILIMTFGIGQEFTGCMDDGYQQWSPNPGSPACNYNQNAIVEGECFYNNCLGVCQEILDIDGNWISNLDFTDTQYDACGICDGNCFTLDNGGCAPNHECSDCAGVPNGTAYINPLCIGIVNEDGCVGGDTGIPDCVIIEIESGVRFYSETDNNYLDVYATNLDTLRSLDIEFTYDSKIINISGFSLYGTDLNPVDSVNYDYEIAYDSFLEAGNFIKVNFTLYFEPHTNLKLFSSDPNKVQTIFKILIETMEIEADTTSQILINKLSVNEILMNDSTNYVGSDFMVDVIRGCMDDGYQQWSPNPGSPACNYDSSAEVDDDSCAYEIDCLGECGGDAVYDECDECNGTETNPNNCTCPETENIIYDCYGDCAPIDGCQDEFSFTPGCAFKDTNCSNICVGGATERYPCEQDCEAILLSTGEWGGSAYEDNCGVCISNTVETIIPEVLDSLDCFRSSFKIYNSNEIENNNFIVKESDAVYIALHMQDLPNSLEGLILNINYNSNDLFLNSWSLNPEEFDLDGEFTGGLNNLNELYIDIDSTFIDSTIFTAVMYTANELYQNSTGNILFLQFSNLGINGDSTLISYTRFLVNEHVMKEKNYIQSMIYFGDCTGIFEGDAYIDDCGDCVGGNTGIDACDLYNNEFPLIPKGYHLSQNYPNPFNPITYINYSIPNYDFITIDIINISGQIIKTIVQSSHQPGNYEIMWDGTNHNDISVPTGIYFYKLDADKFVSVKKLVLLK